VSANRAVGQTNLAAATSNYWQVTGIQLEAGAVATPFEFEDIGVTLAKCQRYYYRIQPGVAGRHLSFGANYGTTINRTSNFLPVSMRAAPTALETTGVANQYAIAQAGIGATQCNLIPAFSAATTDLVTLTGFVASGLTDARVSTISTDATNGVNAYLAWSAEL
jgi:hypothetical protein